MQGLVKQGRWAGALLYLNAFLAENHTRSRRAQIFHNFLLMNFRFANAVAGRKDKSLDKQYAHDRWRSTRAELRFRCLAYTMLASEPRQLVATYDWDKVRRHASFLVSVLADITPELRRSMPLQSQYMMPHLVLPIGSSQHHSSLHGNSGVESTDEALEMLVDLLDQTLQAGLRRGCKLSYASQPCEKEGVPDAPYMQTMLGSSTDNAKGQAPLFSRAPFFEIVSRTSEDHSQDSEVSSLTNAGCHTENPSKGPTSVEDDINNKKQWTTEAFGEASSVSMFGGRASTDTPVNFMPKQSGVFSL